MRELDHFATEHVTVSRTELQALAVNAGNDARLGISNVLLGLQDEAGQDRSERFAHRKAVRAAHWYRLFAAGLAE